jgi:hypothetical protein
MTSVYKNKYSTLSKRCRSLLSKEEDFDVEFKESISSLENEDLVAFANSEHGGTILIGVRETKDSNGRSKSEIIGCTVGEEPKRKILNKAESCVPPVEIQVIEENTSHTPIYRIEISSGTQKPHCTSGGTYKIREDGKNKALLPGVLLSLFLSREQDQFVARFRQATDELGENVSKVKEHMLQELREIERELENIFGDAQLAHANSEEAMVFGDETLGTVQNIDQRIQELEDLTILNEENLVSILDKFGLKDARTIREEKMLEAQIQGELIRKLHEHPKWTKQKIISETKKEFSGIKDIDFDDLFDKVSQSHSI